MRMCVCAVFDVAAAAYGRPFFSASLGLAVRGFSDEVNRVEAGNVMNGHASDFQLFHLGWYEDSTAVFKCEVPPVRLAVASDLLVSK